MIFVVVAVHAPGDSPTGNRKPEEEEIYKLLFAMLGEVSSDVAPPGIESVETKIEHESEDAPCEDGLRGGHFCDGSERDSFPGEETETAWIILVTGVEEERRGYKRREGTTRVSTPCDKRRRVASGVEIGGVI